MALPLLLAVETATEVMSVALLRGDELVAEATTRDERLHSERLLPAVDALLARAGLSLDAVEAFAVSIGPGSFTGLRIGLATVKGLAFGSAHPVAAVPTLAALAAAAPAEAGPVVALLDARRGEVYAGVYARPGEIEAEGGDRVYAPEELAALLPVPCTLVAGEGSGPLAEALAARLGPAVRWVPAEARAARVGRLGVREIAAGRAVAADTLMPLYVRRAEAEVRRTGQRFEPA